MRDNEISVELGNCKVTSWIFRTFTNDMHDLWLSRVCHSPKQWIVSRKIALYGKESVDKN